MGFWLTFAQVASNRRKIAVGAVEANMLIPDRIDSFHSFGQEVLFHRLFGIEENER